MDQSISRKRFLVGLAGLAAVALVDGCGGSSVSNSPAFDPQIAPGQEGLTDAQAALFDAAPHLPPLDLAAVHLADGTSVANALSTMHAEPVRVPDISSREKKEPQNPGPVIKTPGTYKRECLAQMIAAGNALANRAQHQYPQEGPDAPAQNGLGYVFGSKDQTGRSKDTHGERYYGLDASGLIRACAYSGGVFLPDAITAGDLTDPAVWNAALPGIWNLKMMTVTDGTLENGDIVGNEDHVGMIAKSDQTGPAILQSHGTRASLRSFAEDFAQDRLNGGSRRGPTIIPLADLDSYFKKGNLRTVRLAPASSFVVELNWGAQPDLDLHVFEPDGTHVYYPQRTGHSGFLDRDCVTGFGPEHYTTFPSLQDGDYRVGVNYYAGSAPEIAVILISAGTQTSNYRIPLATADYSAGDSNPVMAATIQVATNGATGQKTFTIT